MYTFIVNPHSRSGKGLTTWHVVEAELKRLQIEYTVFFTQYQKHATTYIHNLTSDACTHTVVVLGGDGTLNEVINGIQNFDHITLGYIPTGSSNDFSRSCGIPTDPLEALKRILNPDNVVHMDIGTISFGKQSRRFAVSSGIGFDAAICHEAVVSKWKRILNRFHLGKCTYAMIALHRLFLTSTCKFTVILDDKETLSYSDCWFATVMNHPCEGGGFYFCPDAQTDDGLLDILIVSNLKAPALLLILPFALFGKHTTMPGIHLLRCRKATIKTDLPLPVHTDGEPVFLQHEFSVNVDRQILKVIVF